MGPERFEHLERILQLDGFDVSSGALPIVGMREAIIQVLSEAARIEKNKNTLDLKPNIDFVTANLDKFEHGISLVLQREPSATAVEWAKGIEFKGSEAMVAPQVSPEECQRILSRMPASLLAMSKLKIVNYHLFDAEKHLLPVPGYDENGNFDTTKVECIDPADFPRKKSGQYMVYRRRKTNDDNFEFRGELEEAEEDDHPSRILVGVSNGKAIFPTPIPKTVSEDERAVYLYQIHVLLHEFFHTIDYPRRDPEERAKIFLEVDGRQFSFQDWWQAFEELILSGIEPVCISSYANTYANDLNQKKKEEDYRKFTHALAEQICESFVAYQLGIISNDDGWTDFQREGFGNAKQLNKFANSQASSANLKWLLMDKLCRAKVIMGIE